MSVCTVCCEGEAVRLLVCRPCFEALVLDQQPNSSPCVHDGDDGCLTCKCSSSLPCERPYCKHCAPKGA
jgi:hypothetical protein